MIKVLLSIDFVSFADPSPSTKYLVSYSGQVSETDGIHSFAFGHSVEVDSTVDSKKVDESILQSVVDFILTRYGFTIDEKDIYIPFSN